MNKYNDILFAVAVTMLVYSSWRIGVSSHVAVIPQTQATVEVVTAPEELVLLGNNNLLDFKRVHTLDELLAVMSYVPVTVSAGSSAAVALNKYLRRMTPEDRAALAKLIKQPEPTPTPAPKAAPLPPVAPEGYMLVPMGDAAQEDLTRKQISIPENN